MTVTNPGFWIAATCALVLLSGAIAGAVWGWLNKEKNV